MTDSRPLTSRILNEDESARLMEWLFDNELHISHIEQMSVKETKNLVPLWENNNFLHGCWTVTFTDINIAVYFRLKWC